MRMIMIVYNPKELYDGARLRVKCDVPWVEGTLHDIGSKQYWIFISDEPYGILHNGGSWHEDIPLLDNFISKSDREHRCWWITKTGAMYQMELLNKIIDLDGDDDDCI